MTQSQIEEIENRARQIAERISKVSSPLSTEYLNDVSLLLKDRLLLERSLKLAIEGLEFIKREGNGGTSPYRLGKCAEEILNGIEIAN